MFFMSWKEKTQRASLGNSRVVSWASKEIIKKSKLGKKGAHGIMGHANDVVTAQTMP